MPKYTVELDDGRKVSFESDAPMSRQQIEDTAYEAVGAPKEPGMLEQAGTFVKDAAVGAYNAVTGADRMTPEMRALPEGIQSRAPTIGGALKAGFGVAAASDNKQRQEIYEENYPGVSFRPDAKGNPVGTYEGKDFALNKPGLSQTDLIPAALQNNLFLRGAKAGAKLAPWLGRALGVGTGAAATQVGLDITANMTGARKDAIEMAKSAALAGGLAGGAELFAPAGAKVYQMMRGRPVVNGAGAVTEEARTVMRDAGINPDDMSDEFLTMLRNYSGRMDDPVAAGRLAQGQALPVPIRQTRGQITMNPQQQRLEEAMRANSYGDTAGQRMRGVAADQQAQIGQNLEAIQTGLSGSPRPMVGEMGQGGAAVQSRLDVLRNSVEEPIQQGIGNIPRTINPGLPVNRPGESGVAVSTRLNTMRDAEKAGVDAAYDAARNAEPAFIRGTAADVGVQRITAAVTQGRSLRAVPKVASELNDLAALVPDEVTPASIKDLFQWRQRVSGIRADGGMESVAASDAIRAFDGFVDDAVDNALMSGDEAATGIWRDAISRNRQFADRFKGNDLVGKLVERDYTTNARTLKVEPESAANLIFGRASAGIGKKNIVSDIRKLRETLGPDSQEWASLREESFRRVTGFYGETAPADIGRKWQDAWRDDGPLMSQLFSGRERQQIDRIMMSQSQLNRMFGGDDLVSKLVRRNADGDLAFDAQSASNLIFGGKGVPVKRPNINRDIAKLREMLRPDSQEWNAIREEAFMRFAQSGSGANPVGQQQFSGVNFKKNWSGAWRDNEPLMSQLFTRNERQLVDQFADVSARVTSQTKYGSNPSGTSYAAGDLLMRLPFGRKLRDFLQEAEGATRASQALKVPYREIPAGYLGAGGATAGTRDY